MPQCIKVPNAKSESLILILMTHMVVEVDKINS